MSGASRAGRLGGLSQRFADRHGHYVWDTKASSLATESCTAVAFLMF